MKKQIVLEGLNKKEIRKQMHNIEHDPRIKTGARVRVKSTGEEFTLGRLYEYSRSHKVIYCTSDGRKWTPNTVYKRCEYVEK